MVSVIIPVYNEGTNLNALFTRLAATFSKIKEDYELIFIDDHSTDSSWRIIGQYAKIFPVARFKKLGRCGKAFSLVQGFEQAKGDKLVMIDADLQYPPEAIAQMLAKLKKADVVVANRSNFVHFSLRKVLSRVFRFVFGKSLFNLEADIQSGLKAFSKEVWETVKFYPKTKWAFDLEFLLRAREAGFTIKNHDITFAARKNGVSKIELISNAFELGLNAFSLKIKKFYPSHIPPTIKDSMLGAGVGFRRQKYITHTTLPHTFSAIRILTGYQKLFLFLALIALSIPLVLITKTTAIVLVGLLTLIYFIDTLFNAFLIAKSLNKNQEIQFSKHEIEAISENSLPKYTILCPLYQEAQVLPQFIESIENLNYPKDKLEVLLLLEKDDKHTQKAAANCHLPQYIKTIVVPQSLPKTKPKAINYGLNLATGKYLVIYDAEDRPETDQLKCAYLAFEKYGDHVACFQAKLNYYNAKDNLLTKFFSAEYALWFDLILTGLQSLDTTIPLGGTSNHFKVATLKKLQGWDPFNVTEDCDLGVRLFKQGYQTAMIDSYTLEEAASNFKNWLRQRSRWIKGYIQTFLVHNRDFPAFVKSHKRHSFIFQLVVGGKIAFIFINPLMWLTTIVYFALRTTVGPTIEQFFPSIIFYMAVFCLVAGNFLYLYYYMIALVKLSKFELIKYIFLVPVYWFAISLAATIALYQLIVKPHFWEKTIHGFHLAKRLKTKEELERQPSKLPKIASWRIEALKKLLSSATAAGGILIAATLIANFANFIYNAYLTRALSIEDFGLISLIGSFLLLMSIPLDALSRTVTHKTAYFLGKHNVAIAHFWAKTRNRAIIFSLFITGIWVLLTPTLASFFKAPSYLPFILFAPAWAIGAAHAVDSGFLSGNMRFIVSAIILVSEAIARLLFTWILVSLNQTNYVYAAIPASLIISFVIGWAFARSIKSNDVKIKAKSLHFPINFYVTSVATKVYQVAFLSFDLILAKHFLQPVEAGQYALISLSGKIIYFIGSLFTQFITPLVSHEEGASRTSRQVFYKLFLASTMASLATYIVVGAFGFITLPILFGNKIVGVVDLLPLYGLAMLSFTLASNIVTYYQTRSRHLFVATSLLLALVQVVAITIYHQDLNQIIWVMSLVGLANLLIMVTLHFIYEPARVLVRNISDFALLFVPIVHPYAKSQHLKILIYNWRDTKHVWSGGAEVYINEIAKRLTRLGHQVTIFCGNDGNCRSHEVIDGVQIIRHGGFYTLYIWAPLYYLLHFRTKYDVVIDSENGIPFFTPLFVEKPIVCLIHHVHQEIFRSKLKFPLAQIGKFLEGTAMPFVYKNIKMITVSKSSKQGMEKIGLGKSSKIEIVNPGVDIDQFKPGPKSKEPSILYLGRLQAYKSIEIVILALAKVIKNNPKVTFTIAGEGESRQNLEALVIKLELTKYVRFLGSVSENVKKSLFARSWIMVQPSKIEGWGITAIEANASGTPVIAADVPGLRDSIKNPHSGILVSWGDVQKFAEKIELVITNPQLRKQLEKGSRKWARKFRWNKSTEKLLKIIKAAI